MRSLWLLVWNTPRQETRMGVGGGNVQVGGMGRDSSESIEGGGTGGGLAAFSIVTGSRRSKFWRRLEDGTVAPCGAWGSHCLG